MDTFVKSFSGYEADIIADEINTYAKEKNVKPISVSLSVFELWNKSYFNALVIFETLKS